MPPRKVLAAGVLAVVVTLLLVPHHVDVLLSDASGALFGAAGAPGGPAWWTLEDVANALLFVPVGVVLTARFMPVPALLLGGALSVACESAQTLIPHRHADPADVISNVLGTAAGVAVALLLARRVRRSRQAALAAGGAGPVHAAEAGLGGFHPVQADRAARGVEPALVERAARRRQVGALEVRPVVAAHGPIVPHVADIATGAIPVL